MATKAKKAKKPRTKAIVATAKAYEKALEEIKDLKETVDLASAVLFYILQENNDGKHQDGFKTVFHKYLPKAFDDRPASGFHFELDRDILKQCCVVAAGHQTVVKELPQPETSPIIIQ